ncbi:MAG TPA: adenine deaminase [Puia sp.]|nr:adenine deaminase [Puia sp.]
MNGSVRGNLVDVFQKKIHPAEIRFENGKITSIAPLVAFPSAPLAFILPGFIDAHVHIESSMLIPSEFARLAVVHGTVATVSDPHEIANVCGMKGVEFMIENGKTVPFKFNFGAPSCVPATTFETAGAALGADDVKALLEKDEIKYLSEMMNFPGVLSSDVEVMKKIHSALDLKKPVDGHAPGLRGEAAKKYIEAGISTDHECFAKEEALEKLKYGMNILIREGSAAKNFDALIDLLHDYPDRIMFCSDDKHPDSLVSGHINQLCQRAVAKGIDLFKILTAACINPVLHYQLNVGLLRENDAADFIVARDLKNFEVLQTYIDGQLVAENGKSLMDVKADESALGVNNFHCHKKQVDNFECTTKAAETTVHIIEALDGQLITNKAVATIKTKNGKIEGDREADVLKIVVVNRYADAPMAKAYIKNFGLKRGAIASSVAHDSHNIVAIGVDDKSLCRAVDLIIEKKGGISCVDDHRESILSLPVGGLMSNENGYEIARAYTAIDAMAKNLGSTLSAPFMTLSFMALLVIPHLKLSDKGLFDGDKFSLL